MIAFFLSPLGRLIGVAALAAFLAGSAATWATATIYGARISEMKAEKASEEAARANAVLVKFTAQATIINGAAQEYAAAQGTLGTKLDTIAKDLKNVQARRPLPRNCAPDADRLQNLRAAVDAINPTVGHSPSGPVPHPGSP